MRPYLDKSRVLQDTTTRKSNPHKSFTTIFFNVSKTKSILRTDQILTTTAKSHSNNKITSRKGLNFDSELISNEDDRHPFLCRCNQTSGIHNGRNLIFSDYKNVWKFSFFALALLVALTCILMVLSILIKVFM